MFALSTNELIILEHERMKDLNKVRREIQKREYLQRRRGSYHTLNIDVMDLSKYIINYATKNKKPINNMDLQKILFLIQKYFLINSNAEVFPEIIEALVVGPVVERVYYTFKKYKHEKIEESYDISLDEKYRLGIEITIDKLLNKFLNMNSLELSNLILNPNGAWRTAINENMEITSNLIKEKEF